MNFREAIEPVVNKEVTIKDMLDEASCQMIETCCMLDGTLKGLGVDPGWDGTDKNPENMMDEAKILMSMSRFCMEAAKRLHSLLF